MAGLTLKNFKKLPEDQQDRIIKRWSQKHDYTFAEAIAAISDDMRDNGTGFDGSLSHYADLFQIDREALRHEWNLRNEDTR